VLVASQPSVFPRAVQLQSDQSKQTLLSGRTQSHNVCQQAPSISTPCSQPPGPQSLSSQPCAHMCAVSHSITKTPCACAHRVQNPSPDVLVSTCILPNPCLLLCAVCSAKRHGTRQAHHCALTTHLSQVVLPSQYKKVSTKRSGADGAGRTKCAGWRQPPRPPPLCPSEVGLPAVPPARGRAVFPSARPGSAQLPG
jgi:hypothetical protein